MTRETAQIRIEHWEEGPAFFPSLHRKRIKVRAIQNPVLHTLKLKAREARKWRPVSVAALYSLVPAA